MNEKWMKKIKPFYKDYRTETLIDKDMKMVKKINNLTYKYLNTENERYREECINIVKTLSNLARLEDEFIDIITDKIIEDKYVNHFLSYLKEI